MNNVTSPTFTVQREHRAARNRQQPFVLWFTGLSGAGKSVTANAVEVALFGRGFRTAILDGDSVRHGLCGDLGFDPDSRAENLRRVGEVCALMLDAGLIVIAAFISPERSERARLRERLAPAPFVECHVATSLEECEARDPKGLYARARRGEIAEFTGVSAPYEAPLAPEITLRTSMEPERDAETVVGYLLERGLLQPRAMVDLAEK